LRFENEASKNVDDIIVRDEIKPKTDGNTPDKKYNVIYNFHII